ncbi:hypothetical protein B0H10DRAFT_2206931 [Mycena sp. CBHHK59/15]|nr:hypothetical protein B0H10DRAFT_2206931 [Mycena sp. CBHHK59/15]
MFLQHHATRVKAAFRRKNKTTRTLTRAGFTPEEITVLASAYASAPAPPLFDIFPWAEHTGPPCAGEHVLRRCASPSRVQLRLRYESQLLRQPTSFYPHNAVARWHRSLTFRLLILPALTLSALAIGKCAIAVPDLALFFARHPTLLALDLSFRLATSTVRPRTCSRGLRTSARRRTTCATFSRVVRSLTCASNY